MGLKRFLAFAGDSDEEVGGWSGFFGHFDTEEEARANLAEIAARPGRWPWGEFSWWHVIDSEKVPEDQQFPGRIGMFAEAVAGNHLPRSAQ